jgi:PAS domain S-box-containing protein
VFLLWLGVACALGVFGLSWSLSILVLPDQQTDIEARVQLIGRQVQTVFPHVSSNNVQSLVEQVQQSDPLLTYVLIASRNGRVMADSRAGRVGLSITNPMAMDCYRNGYYTKSDSTLNEDASGATGHDEPILVVNMPLRDGNGAQSGGISFGVLTGGYQESQRKYWLALLAVSVLFAGLLLILAYLHFTELRHSEERFRALINNSLDMLFVTDEHGNIRFENASVAATLGYGPGGLIGHRIFDFIHPEDQTAARREFEAIWNGKSPRVPIEFRAQHADGSQLCLEAVGSNQMRTPALRGVVFSVRNVTERRQSRETREHLEAQLRQAQKLEAIGTLAGGIAHDFNNILAAIICNAEMAREDTQQQPAVREFLDGILRASQRARELVRQILSFSRQSKPERRPITLQPLIKEALKLLRSTLPTTVEIVADIPADLPMVLGDPTQIHQVLMNLCTNASHAMQGQNGILKVMLSEIVADESLAGLLPEVRKDASYVRLTISDTGCGMDEETVARVFEPFFTTKGPGEGTGLGLSVVHGIVKEHGGIIRVKSVVGSGTTFDIYFPVIQAAARPKDVVVAGVTPGKGQRILLVDDEEDLIKAVKVMLERLGYQVTAESSPIRAFQIFEASPQSFDVVVTDLTMPGMTGDELSERMLRIKPDLPIILLSGYASTWSVEMARAAGLFDIMTKPANQAQLADVLARALGTPEAEASLASSANRDAQDAQSTNIQPS